MVKQTNTPKIAVWGDGNLVISLLPVLKEKGISVEYVKQDKKHSYSDTFIEAVNNLGYPCYIDYYPNIDLDLVLTVNYNCIVTDEQLGRYLFVNHHVGLLPKWRGNSANGWAIINGENEVGYTLHKITHMLDDGPIYYRFKYPYHEGKTYVEAKKAMEEDLKFNIVRVVNSVIENPNDFLDEPVRNFVYCSKFRPVDGIIEDWNITTEEIIRKLYVFGPPLGTGLKFSFKGIEYEIRALSRVPMFAKSKGVSGGIVNIDNGAIWIKTKDSAIAITEIYANGEKVDVSKSFVIGQRL